MFEKVVPVNRERHAQKKIREINGFSFASQFHIAYVTMHEFARASAVYPIVFLEDKAQDEFRPVALLGLDAGENLFVGEGGKWEASYVPAIIRRYPFALASTDQEGQFTICIDEASELVSDTEGAALFDDKGEPTQVIENVKRYLSELQQMDALTREFAKFLAQNNMLTPLNMRVRENDRVKNIAGCYVINEERLNNLSDERFLELRAKRYLPAIYAQLISLAQIERLMTLKDKRNAAAPASAN
ncbi:SapC family protein [uncultured Azohydromonas sp.]|jgi:SapC.|uniref:SapC family protein n=1 Tax=uncultured Azohydromonas sp. TaxID=487342 RepID=UPI00262B6683|nr:SapC family protein [uncultured Azohydromonas sp.]